MTDRDRPGGSAFSWVGRPVDRVDGLEKVTGAARFTSDIEVPGMLHAAIVPSLYPAGVIEAIRFDDALSVRGVHAAISAQDLAQEPIGCLDPSYGPVLRDQPILAGPLVRYVGEPVAAIVAEDARLAREAAELVEVQISQSPAVTDLEGALAENAPLVHSSPPEQGDFGGAFAAPDHSNICAAHEEKKGDIGKGLSEADEVFEDEFEFPSVYHYAMEPHSAIAEANERGVTIWSSCQHPHVVAKDVARMFGFPLSGVRIIATYVGGGFGSKSFTHIEPLVVALSLAARRPVKLALNVSEAMRVSRRHGARMKIRSGVTRDGLLTAMDIEVFYDTGAYALTGPVVAAKGCFRSIGGYELSNYRVRSHAVYVNTSPAGSFRSIGGPQAAWGVEAQLNRIALALGIDPFELRRRNVAVRGSEFRPGRRTMDADLRKNLDLLETVSPAADDIAESPWRRGMGVALAVTDPAARATSTAILKLATDGSVTVSVGSSELGQGIRTVVAQIAAEVLDVAIDMVRVLQTDTGYGPYDTSTGASRSTTMTGLAVQRAAEDIARRLVTYASECWEGEGEPWIAGGSVHHPDGRKIAYGDAIRQMFGQDGGNIIGVGAVTEHEFPDAPPFWEIASGAATVLVDAATGLVRVLSYQGVSDLGKVMNPVMAEGQEAGAIVQGLGHSLSESLVWEAGEPLVTSLVDYRVPRFVDIPSSFTLESIEDENGPGPFGAKGGGEGAIVPVAAAISSGVEAALGVRLRRLPLTPEEVWRAMQDASASTGSTSQAAAEAQT